VGGPLASRGAGASDLPRKEAPTPSVVPVAFGDRARHANHNMAGTGTVTKWLRLR
jgi:hypothetical protein